MPDSLSASAFIAASKTGADIWSNHAYVPSPVPSMNAVANNVQLIGTTATQLLAGESISYIHVHNLDTRNFILLSVDNAFTPNVSLFAKILPERIALIPPHSNVWAKADTAACNTRIVSVTLAASGPPAAPSGLTVTINGANHDLAWTDNSSNETSFDIARNFERGAFNESFASNPANDTTYTDSTTAGDVAYGYRVRARNGAGTSAWDDHIALAPYGLGCPEFLTTLRELAWNLAGGNPSICTGVEIWRKIAAGSYSLLTTAAANSTSYNDTEDLSANEGQTIFYKVREVNSVGNSAYSNEISGTLTAP